jgi:hypothetical protein
VESLKKLVWPAYKAYEKPTGAQSVDINPLAEVHNVQTMEE